MYSLTRYMLTSKKALTWLGGSLGLRVDYSLWTPLYTFLDNHESQTAPANEVLEKHKGFSVNRIVAISEYSIFSMECN